MESRADHRWSRMPRALLGRLHLIHISGLQSYLLPPVSAPRQAGLELLWVRTLGKFICLYQRSRSSSTTHTQYIWVKTGHSHNWRNTGKWEFTLTKQEFYPRSKEKKIDQKNVCMLKRQISCLLPFVLGRRMHSYYLPFITDNSMTTPTAHAVVTTLENWQFPPIPSHCGTLVSKQDYIFLRVFLMLDIQLPSSKIWSKQPPPPQPHKDQSWWQQQAREDSLKSFPLNWTLSILDPWQHRNASLMNVSCLRPHLHRNHKKAVSLTHFQVVLIVFNLKSKFHFDNFPSEILIWQ